MPEPRLLIDLGNSRLKWLWSRGVELDLDSAGRGDLAALGRACQSPDATRPAVVLIASVAAAERTAQVVDLCAGLWSVQPRLLVAEAEQMGVRNGYLDPARLGVDRWLAILGAVSHYGKPVVVWDLGTATTLDAVDATGQHLGGWILPGPTTMLGSLDRQTTLRAALHFSPPQSGPLQPGPLSAIEPGRCTADAIRGGVLAAQIGALHRFLGQVAEQIGQTPRLVVTGGAAPAVAPMLTPILTSGLDVEFIADPWLVFRGMARVQ
jgi:type III pantothenate kinase